jgi:hypothetical protein
MMQDGVRRSRTRGRAALAAILLLGTALAGPVAVAEPVDEAIILRIGRLPVDDQYQTLRLLQLLAEGGGTDFEGLLAGKGVTAGNESSLDESLIRIGDATTQLSDPKLVLSCGLQIMKAAQKNGGWLATRIAELEASSPQLAARFKPVVLEDAVKLRSFMSEQLERLGVDPADSSFQEYFSQTTRLRDDLEFISFEDELKTITADSVNDLGSKLDIGLALVEKRMDPESVAAGVARAETMNAATREQVQTKMFSIFQRVYAPY